MNKLDEHTHASASDIDDLLAELGYHGSPTKTDAPPLAEEDLDSLIGEPILPTKTPEPEPPLPAPEKKMRVAKEKREKPKREPKPSKPPKPPKERHPVPEAFSTPIPEPEEILPLPEIPVLDIPLVERKPAKAPRPKYESKLVARLQDALEEDVDEIEMLTALPALTDGKEMTLTKKQRNHRRLYFCVGVFFFLLAAVGLISIAGRSWQGVSAFTKNTSQKDEFADFIAPLVVMDIPDFTDSAELDSDQMVTAAIWRFIMQGDFSRYQQTLGVVTVPALDIDTYAAQLFGSDLTLSHKTLGQGNLRFYFSEDTNSYNIPTTPAFFSYQPVVETLQKSGDLYTLTVAYQQETPSWQADQTMAPIAKRVTYVVEETKDQKRIVSVQTLAEPNLEQ